MKGVEVFDHARTGWSAVCVKQNMLMRVGEHFRSEVKCNTDGAMGAHYKKHHPN